MNLRDIDIKIATLLGHYRLCKEGAKAFYTTNLNQTGGSLAMSIFKGCVKEEHQWDVPESVFEQSERQWWQSETNPDMWYTSAVPLYTTDIIEALKLLDEVIKEGFDTTLYNIGNSWCCRIGDECFYVEGFTDTKEEAICNAFILFKERDI